MLISNLDNSLIVLAQQDSTELRLSEKKQISGLLYELEYRRTKDNIWMDKESVYKSIIKDFQNGEELYKQEVKNLELNIEAVRPAWYDNFWTGSAVTAIIISSIYFLTR